MTLIAFSTNMPWTPMVVMVFAPSDFAFLAASAMVLPVEMMSSTIMTSLPLRAMGLIILTWTSNEEMRCFSKTVQGMPTDLAMSSAHW